MLSSEKGDSHRQRDLRSGEWACVGSKCATVNSDKHSKCISCGKSKPQPKNKAGLALGKEAAEKSKGLFSAEDWMCTKCGNVNWAKRNTCNVCNAKKFVDLEVRSGFGGGFNDRQNVEYVKRSDNDEFDEFGRRKKRETKEGQTSEERQLEENGGEDDEEESGDEDLGKYDLTDFDDVKIPIFSKFKQKVDEKEENASVASSDCSCSCSGGECSCEEETDEETKAKRSKKDNDRSRDYRRSPNRHNDRRYNGRDRERRRSHERNRR